VASGVLLIGVAAFALPDPRDGLVTWAGTTFGALYVGLLAFVVRLGHAAPPVPADAPLARLSAEQGWILLLVLGVWAFDTGAYFAGRRLGRRRFLAHISPSKTYAGLFGGLVAATLVCAAMLAGLGEPPSQAIVLGPLIGLAAQAGDLSESLVKRAARAKDSGTLIPGHGGVLDRIDSFLFAAPVVTLYVVAFVV
jgi:CDP-diglyceride synthetase